MPKSAALVLGFGLAVLIAAGPAVADLTVLSMSASASSSTSAPYGSPQSDSQNYPGNGYFGAAAGASSSGYNDAPPEFLISDSASASAVDGGQVASGPILEGSGIAESSAAISYGSNPTSFPNVGDAIGNDATSMTFTFTDSQPETLVLSGDLIGNSAYHPGPLGVIMDDLTLSSADSGVIYGVATNNLASITRASGSSVVPISFTMVLDPSVVYTFSASDSTESDANDLSLSDNTSASFSFTISVPEPASLGIILASLPLLGRRRGH